MINIAPKVQSRLPDMTGIFAESIRPVNSSVNTPISKDGLLGQNAAFNRMSSELRREFSMLQSQGINILKSSGGSIDKLQRSEQGMEWFQRLDEYYQKEQQLQNALNVITDNQERFKEDYASDRERLDQIYIDPVTGQGVLGPMGEYKREKGLPVTGDYLTLGDMYENQSRNLGVYEDGTPAFYKKPKSVDSQAFNVEVTGLLEKLGQTQISHKSVHSQSFLFGSEDDPDAIAIMSQLEDVTTQTEQFESFQQNFYMGLSQEARDAVAEEFYRNLNKGYIYKETVTEKDKDGKDKQVTMLIDTPYKYASMKARSLAAGKMDYTQKTELVPSTTKMLRGEDVERKRISAWEVLTKAVDMSDDFVDVQMLVRNDKGDVINMPGGAVDRIHGVVPAGKRLDLSLESNNLSQSVFGNGVTNAKLAEGETFLSAIGVDQVFDTTFGILDIRGNSSVKVVSFGNSVITMGEYQKENGRYIPKAKTTEEINSDGTKSFKTKSALYVEIILEFENYGKAKDAIGGYFNEEDGFKYGNLPGKGKMKNTNLFESTGKKPRLKVYVPVNFSSAFFNMVDASGIQEYIRTVERQLKTQENYAENFKNARQNGIQE